MLLYIKVRNEALLLKLKILSVEEILAKITGQHCVQKKRHKDSSVIFTTRRLELAFLQRKIFSPVVSCYSLSYQLIQQTDCQHFVHVVESQSRADDCDFSEHQLPNKKITLEKFNYTFTTLAVLHLSV